MDSLIRVKNKLRIWHIAETYPPDYGGGAAVYVQDICRALASRGHEVRVLCVESVDGEEPYALRSEYDGPVRIDRINLPYFKSVDPEGWRLGIRRWRSHERQVRKVTNQLLSTWTPDLVHYSTTRPLGEECILAITKAGIPVVGFLHEAWLICPQVMLLRSPTSTPCPGPKPVRCLECVYSYYDRTHLRAAMKFPWRLIKLGFYPAYRLWRRASARRRLTAAMAYSRFMQAAHLEHVPGEVRYLPLGITTQVPKELPPRPRTPLRFGFIAGFQQHKGINHVLAAAESLKREGFSFELHVWGPNQENGSAEIGSRGLQDDVFLRGVYQPEDIWNVYAEMDVALMATTVCEPFGRVPLEAAAAGAPTIAPAIGGIVESIRHGVDGLLYRFRDSDDLTRQMRRVLEEAGLVRHLIGNLRNVPDTRNASSAVEQFYFDVLACARAGTEPVLAVAQ